MNKLPQKSDINDDITVQHVPQTRTGDDLLMTAVASGANIEVLERLLAMKREVDKDNARSAFIQAMTGFQGECPSIEKTKEVKSNGRLMYSYAPLDAIVQVVRPLLAKHNLSYAVDVENTEASIKAICTITHVLGHSETSSFTVPTTSGTNLMSAPQKIASAMTYAKRYAFCNALGILTTDEDTDAIKDDEKKPLDKKAQIVKLIQTLGHTDKETMTEAIKTKTKLDPKDEKNHDEIISRLEILVDEMNSETTKEL